jgi:hypothetical protein
MRTIPTLEDITQLEHLNTATGAAGSGNVRYAAAMYFYQCGALGGKALEIYRALAKDDLSDPYLALNAAGCEEEMRRLKGKTD